MDEREKSQLNKEMDSDTTIGDRIALWLQAQKLKDRKFTAAQVCRLIDCAENAFSQYKTGERPLPVEIADKLRARFGLSLDWLYCGDPRALDMDLQLRLKTAEDVIKQKKIAAAAAKMQRRRVSSQG